LDLIGAFGVYGAPLLVVLGGVNWGTLGLNGWLYPPLDPRNDWETRENGWDTRESDLHEN